MLLVAMAVTAAPSAAQEPPAVSIVRIVSVNPVIASYACGDIDATVTPGEIVLARTGALTEDLAVSFELTEGTGPLPGSTLFQPGVDTVSIFVALGSYVPSGPIVVILTDDDGYELGQPATATVPVDDTAVEQGCPPYAPPPAQEPRVVEPTFTG
jgi:hypothetical protein